MLPLAERVKKLKSANDAKTGEQNVFCEIHINHAIGTP